MKPASSEIELDLGRYELRRLGRRVKIQKQPMELLMFLVGRREQLVTREDIIAKLWRSNFFVDSNAAINNIVRKIRTALRDDPAKPRFIETVAGKGYRFIGPVHVVDNRYPRNESQFGGHGKTSPPTWPQRSSLAVIPLLRLAKAAEDHGISLGFADALASRLGNTQGLDVLPVSAVLNIPAETPASEIAARLGVRFIVHGGVQPTKGQWHLCVEMFDAHFGGPCFTQRRDFDLSRLPELENEISRQIAGALNRPLQVSASQSQGRYSKDSMAYSDFMRGYSLSSSGDPELLDKAVEHLTNAVTRDPAFSLAHATLSFACATRHYESDPTSVWLDKAEFHCRRALELNPNLAEAHVTNAFLLWGPSRNFQHVEAIAELKRALALQSNLPHAYNRFGTILAHIGLLDHAREMYERGRAFHPKRAMSHSILQVYLWNQEYDLARDEIQAWRAENPTNKYPIYFAPQPAMMVGDWLEAKRLLDEAAQLLGDEPLVISLQGLYYALTGDREQAVRCLAQACACPKSFGHAHHVYYQVACILAVVGRHKDAFEWLERSVAAGFACWPFFLKDRCLESVRALPEFDVLVSSLQAKYPDDLGFR
jgi:DNA-binding winged helix-turn-helix (wHTH) protein/tetratricopeptide (TPR) repeat protein